MNTLVKFTVRPATSSRAPGAFGVEVLMFCPLENTTCGLSDQGSLYLLHTSLGLKVLLVLLVEVPQHCYAKAILDTCDAGAMGSVILVCPHLDL